MTRDLRQYAKQTSVHLMIGGLLLAFVVGDGLIYIFLGKQPAIMGLFCLGAATAPLILIWLILWAMDWLVKRSKLPEERYYLSSGKSVDEEHYG